MKAPVVTATKRVVLPRGLQVTKRFNAKVVSIKDVTDDAGNPKIRIRVPVSSTTRDRDGDEFSERGLKSLIEQYKSGKVPVFLDHGRSPGDFGPTYNVLDMQGGWVDAEIMDDVVYADADLDAGDWRSQELARKMRAGLPIGWSVGFMVREAEELKNEKAEATGGICFHDVDLFETSAVGIPSNPDGVAHAITVLAKHFGGDEQALRQRLGLQEAKDMTQKQAEQASAEASKEAEEKTEAKGLTAEEVRAILAEDRKDLVKEVVEALKEADDEEDEEKDEEEEEEEEEKASPPPRRKTPAPRALGAGTGAPDEGTETKGWMPYQTA